MLKFYICIDVGGTEIKGGIIDKDYNIICQDKIKTNEIAKTNSLSKTIIMLVEKLETNSKLKAKNALGMGIGLPGLVDNKTGDIEYIPSLKIYKTHIVTELKEYLNIPIQIANDAELATLAEQRLGNGVGYDNFVMLTIGTGIGCGIILNGQSLRSALPFACEYGHTKISDNPKEDFEILASTKALISQTKQAMIENPNSKIWQTYTKENVSGKTVFEYKDIDKTAKNVFENYISNLGKGIVNLCNTFSSELIIIGGGISGQGENLTKPLEDFVNKNMFTKIINKTIKILPAKFMNDSGILGARCLFK